MRLIDADALIEQLKGIISDYTSNGMFPNGYDIESAIDSLTDAPTVDPVHSINGCYCWECEDNTVGHCAKMNGRSVVQVGFCGYGKRKQLPDITDAYPTA